MVPRKEAQAKTPSVYSLGVLLTLPCGTQGDPKERGPGQGQLHASLRSHSPYVASLSLATSAARTCYQRSGALGGLAD